MCALAQRPGRARRCAVARAARAPSQYMSHAWAHPLHRPATDSFPEKIPKSPWSASTPSRCARRAGHDAALPSSLSLRSAHSSADVHQPPPCRWMMSPRSSSASAAPRAWRTYTPPSVPSRHSAPLASGKRRSTYPPAPTPPTRAPPVPPLMPPPPMPLGARSTPAAASDATASSTSDAHVPPPSRAVIMATPSPPPSTAATPGAPRCRAAAVAPDCHSRRGCCGRGEEGDGGGKRHGSNANANTKMVSQMLGSSSPASRRLGFLAAGCVWLAGWLGAWPAGRLAGWLAGRGRRRSDRISIFVAHFAPRLCRRRLPRRRCETRRTRRRSAGRAPKPRTRRGAALPARGSPRFFAGTRFRGAAPRSPNDLCHRW